MQPTDRMRSHEDFAENPGETVADAIHRRLVEAILYGDLASTDRLILQELADRFQVSLTPIREALQRMATEGFIEAIPRRGYRIRVPSPRHVAELWQVRIGLEQTAGELAVATLLRGENFAAVRQLEAIQHELDSTADLSHRRHIELNALFHQTLVEASGNRLLGTIYHGIQMQLLGAWVQRGSDDWRSRLASESVEHAAIIKALVARDANAVSLAIRIHLGRSLDGALRDIEARAAARVGQTGILK